MVVAVMNITEFCVNGKFVTTGADTNKGYTTKDSSIIYQRITYD